MREGFEDLKFTALEGGFEIPTRSYQGVRGPNGYLLMQSQRQKLRDVMDEVHL